MKAKLELRALRNLYDLLPKADIPCVEGCSQCCGPVPTTRQELRRAPNLLGYANQVEIFENSNPYAWCGTCPYVIKHGGGCAIYDDRPFMCRLFGLVADEPQLRCPHGLRTTTPITPARAQQLLDKYSAIRDSDPEMKEMGRRTAEAWFRLREDKY
jgi:uncharacterized protein